MKDKKIFVLFGNDKRQFEIAKLLKSQGHTVRMCHCGQICEEIKGCDIYIDWRHALVGGNVIVLPLPITRDGENLAYSDEAIALKDIISYAVKCGCELIVGGLIPDEMITEHADSIKFDDYYRSEELQRKNALPSAEGALMLAMENTDTIIRGMNVLISGYGRIGYHLADILYLLGANVTIAARRDESLCEAALKGYKTVRIGVNGLDLTSNFKDFDVIFNTVPHQIFKKASFSELKEKAVYIEIASAPYGLDITAARESGVHVIFAPSIPSKYAPATAGRYIFEAISEILSKRGMIL